MLIIKVSNSVYFMSAFCFAQHKVSDLVKLHIRGIGSRAGRAHLPGQGRNVAWAGTLWDHCNSIV